MSKLFVPLCETKSYFLTQIDIRKPVTNYVLLPELSFGFTQRHKATKKSRGFCAFVSLCETKTYDLMQIAFENLFRSSTI